MSDIVCPICGKTSQVKVLLSKSQDQVDVGAWSCSFCRHAWRTEPWRLSDAEGFFEKACYTKLEFAKQLDSTKMELFEFFADYAEKANPGQPRLMVDFGCSYGTVLQMFRHRNWRVMGIEISPTAQKILDERNLPWAPALERSGLALQSVDVVVMSDCIYYLPEPLKTLNLIRSYMKPGGLLLLRQSSRGGLVYLLSLISKKTALWNRLWLDHVHLFSRKSTELALKQSGFGDIHFLREKHFKHSFNAEVLLKLLYLADSITLRNFELTVSWTVVAKAGKNLSH